jgi:hypothetical protein
MNHSELTAIVPYAGWIDGRTGYIFPRFDALLTDESPYYWATIVWTEVHPHLILETNTVIKEFQKLVRFDSVDITLTFEEGVTFITNDPANLLVIFAHRFENLKTPKVGMTP